MAERVIEAGNLARNSAFLNAFDLADRSVGSTKGLVGVLLDNIFITPIEQSNLVDIAFTSPDAKVSADIANLWANEFLSANYEKRFGANISAQRYLQQQIEERRQELAKSERQLIEYANANGLIVLNAAGGSSDSSQTAGQTLVESELTALSQALAQATSERIRAQSAYQAGARSAAESGASTALRNSLAQARAELAQLQQNFGPSYPDIVSKKGADCSAGALAWQRNLTV